MIPAAGDSVLRQLEFAEPRVGHGQVVRDHRRRQRIGLALKIGKRSLHLARAVTQMAQERRVRAHQCSRKGPGADVVQRGADLGRSLGRVLELRTRLRHLAALVAQKCDPEVRVREQLGIGVLTGRHCALQVVDLASGGDVRPRRLRCTDGGAQPHLRLSVACQRARPTEEGDRFATGEALERVVAGRHQVLSRARRVPSLLKMHRDHCCKLALPVRMNLEDGLGSGAMQ